MPRIVGSPPQTSGLIVIRSIFIRAFYCSTEGTQSGSVRMNNPGSNQILTLNLEFQSDRGRPRDRSRREKDCVGDFPGTITWYKAPTFNSRLARHYLTRLLSLVNPISPLTHAESRLQPPDKSILHAWHQCTINVARQELTPRRFLSGAPPKSIDKIT